MSAPASVRYPLDTSTASLSDTLAISPINTLTSVISGSSVEMEELSLSCYNINKTVASVWQ